MSHARKQENDRPSRGRHTRVTAKSRYWRAEAGLERGEITTGLDVLLHETNGFDADAADLVEDLQRSHLDGDAQA